MLIMHICIQTHTHTHTHTHTQMSLSSSHSWTRRDRSEKDDPLARVIEQGLLKPNIATDIVGVVLEEIVRVADRSAVY